MRKCISRRIIVYMMVLSTLINLIPITTRAESKTKIDYVDTALLQEMDKPTSSNQGVKGDNPTINTRVDWIQLNSDGFDYVVQNWTPSLVSWIKDKGNIVPTTLDNTNWSGFGVYKHGDAILGLNEGLCSTLQQAVDISASKDTAESIEYILRFLNLDTDGLAGVIVTTENNKFKYVYKHTKTDVGVDLTPVINSNTFTKNTLTKPELDEALGWYPINTLVYTYNLQQFVKAKQAELQEAETEGQLASLKKFANAKDGDVPEFNSTIKSEYSSNILNVLNKMGTEDTSSTIPTVTTETAPLVQALDRILRLQLLNIDSTSTENELINEQIDQTTLNKIKDSINSVTGDNLPGDVSLLDIMVYLNQLSRYTGLQAFGTNIVVAEPAANQIQRSALLDGLSVNYKTSFYKINTPVPEYDLNSTLGIHSDIKVVDNTKYTDLYFLLSLTANFASEEEHSGITDVDGSSRSNPTLEEVLKTEESMTQVLSGKIAKQVKAYKAIKETLDYFKISPWTDDLRYIYNIYDRIKELQFDITLDDINKNDIQPYTTFFDYDSNKLTKYIMTGIAQSSTYTPMQTNVYDVNSIKVLDDKAFVTEFHVKYGFHRKALLIDENTSSATDYYISGKKGSTRVVTLGDLFEKEKDVTLYLDDNLYNIDKIAEIQGKNYDRLVNAEDSGSDKSGNSIGDMFKDIVNLDFEAVAKSGPNKKYNTTLANSVKQYDDSGTWEIFSFGMNKSILMNEEIKYYMEKKDYEYTQGFAVVSAIYRDKNLANRLNKIISKNEPVFVSSPNLYQVFGVDDFNFNTFYNYYMLANLEELAGNDYKTRLDMDSPIFMDIYGNIITESGLVVIPAASNATLIKGTQYSPYTMGFIKSYAQGTNLKVTRDNELVANRLVESGNFYLEEEGKHTYVRLTNKKINFTDLNTYTVTSSNLNAMEALYRNAIAGLNDDQYIIDKYIYIITETLRGAPIEYIDYEREGLIGKTNLSTTGLKTSYKLDELSDNLASTTNGNNLIAIEDISTNSYLAIGIAFAGKLILLMLMALLLYKIFIDTLANRLGVKTIKDVMVNIGITLALVLLIPTLLDVTFNGVNRVILQNEASFIQMINTQKKAEGKEISAVGVTEPKTKSEFSLKLDKVSTPWVKLLTKLTLEPVSKVSNEIYDEVVNNHVLADVETVEVNASGVFISVDDLFNTSSILYNQAMRLIYQSADKDLVTSYYLPYYYILDNFISNINNYNSKNSIVDYTTSIQANGITKTHNLITPYFTSIAFMEQEQDISGMKTLYGLEVLYGGNNIDYETNSMDYTLWYQNTEDLTEQDIETLTNKLDKLDRHIRSFIVNNRELLGKVSDDTLLKMIALNAALEYNNIFKVPSARNIEVDSIDIRDLIRLGISSKDEVFRLSSESFGKFIYLQGGTFAVIVAALLVSLCYIVALVKPLLIFILIALCVYSIIIRRLILNEQNRALQGLALTCIYILTINTSYALMLKLCFSLASLGINTLVSLIVQCVLQVVYLLIVVNLLKSLNNDVVNIAFSAHMAKISKASEFVSGKFNNLLGLDNYNSTDYHSPNDKLGNPGATDYITDLRHRMLTRDVQREQAMPDDASLTSDSFVSEVTKEGNGVSSAQLDEILDKLRGGM